MALDLGSMPAAAGEESTELDLGLEDGMGSKDDVFKDISDEELLAEAEKRQLIDPEDIEAPAEEGMEGMEGLGDLGL